MGGIVQPCFLLITKGLRCVIFARRFSNGTTMARSASGSTARLPNSSAERLAPNAWSFSIIRSAKRNDQQQTDEHATSQRAPVMLVHCDYTPNSGPLRVRQLLPDEADQLLQHRVAFYNLWTPLRGSVEEKPLAMCDVTSSTEHDFLTMKLRYRDREGEIFVLRYSPRHRWWYFPHMTQDHAILLKTYDSETDGRARFIGHSAFDDPDTPPDATMRESIEIRTIAFF